MFSQRLFYHLRVPFAHGDAMVPLVILVHHEDVERLSHVSSAVEGEPIVRDIVAILQQHGRDILPLLQPDGTLVISSGAGTAVSLGSGKQASNVPQATYHGELVSAKFSILPGEDEGRYQLMSHAGAAGGAANTRYRSVPIAAFTLYAHVKHKEAEVERRRVKLAAEPGSIIRFTTGAAGPAAPEQLLPASLCGGNGISGGNGASVQQAASDKASAAAR